MSIFCKCGTLLNLGGRGSQVTCKRCSSTSKVTKKLTKTEVKEYIKEKVEEIKISKNIIKQTCEKCGNNEMYFYTLQTRSADEGQTVFYECKCGYKTKVTHKNPEY